MDFGAFTIDVGIIERFLSQPTLTIVTQIFASVGWIFLVWLLLFAGEKMMREYRVSRHVKNWKYRVLAIDIPQINVQTPMAVEQMFAHLAGALVHMDLKEKYWDGIRQRWFSLEIVGIEGYIQFLIWTEEAFIDLVEASVYAQYPEAEITEVEDYVNSVPDTFPNKTHDIWISDFGLSAGSAFPLRSYREFEHSISKDTVLKDPMGTFLESFSRIGPGEQMWFQILIEPTGNSWKEEVIEKVNELIGATSGHGHGGGMMSKLTDNMLTKEMGAGFREIMAQLTGGEAAEAAEAHADEGPPNQLQYLTPGKKTLVEAMEKKISKIGFKTKIRGAYIARKEVYNPNRGVNALLGAITQFNSPMANSLESTVHAHHNRRIDLKRKNKLMKAYKKRKIGTGGNAFVLNIEELATIWHFPMSHVKTPLVQKSQVKAAEPPPSLPVESVIGGNVAPSAEEMEEERKTYTTDTGEVIHYDEE